MHLQWEDQVHAKHNCWPHLVCIRELVSQFRQSDESRSADLRGCDDERQLGNDSKHVQTVEVPELAAQIAKTLLDDAPAECTQRVGIIRWQELDVLVESSENSMPTWDVYLNLILTFLRLPSLRRLCCLCRVKATEAAVRRETST